MFDGVLTAYMVEADRLQGEILSITGALRLPGEDEPALIQQLQERLGQRSRLATRIGLAVLRWRQAGAESRAAEAAPEVPAAAEAAPEVPVEAEAAPDVPAEAAAVIPAAIPADPATPAATVGAQTGSLSRLQAHFGSRADFNPTSNLPIRPPEGHLRKTVLKIRRPEGCDGANAFRDDLDSCYRFCYDIEQIKVFDQETQKNILELLAAKMRHLQEIYPSVYPHLDMEEMQQAFRRLTAHAKQHLTTPAYGLALRHPPRHGSWLKDAARCWEELIPAVVPVQFSSPDAALEHLQQVMDTGTEDLKDLVVSVLDAGVTQEDPRLIRMLIPALPHLDHQPRLKKLRKMIRNIIEEDDLIITDSVKESTEIPADWPWWEKTRGRQALMIGGDRREETQKRLKDVFGFADVAWDSGWRSRKVQALCEQIRKGHFDVVIFLTRFMNHSDYEMMVPACKAVGVEYVVVERGYGISQIRQRMEAVLRLPESTAP